MPRGRPIFREDGHVYRADTCDPLVEAVERGTVRLESLARGHYPGRPLADDELPAVKSIGYWDAKREQDWGLAEHRNEGLEITFLESGSLDFTLDDHTHSLAPNDLTITRPWQAHRVGSPRVTPGRLHWLILDLGVRRPNQPWKWPSWIILTDGDRERLTTILRQNEQPVWHATDEVRRCWRKIGQAVRAGDRLSHVAIFINEMLLELLDMFTQREAPLNPHLSSSQRTVKLFLDEMARSPTDLEYPWTVRKMAAACGLGVTRFTRLCQELTNVTPMQYLARCRVDAAAELLRSSPDMTVTQIAHACGFASSQYFATVFRRQHGVSPKAWRDV